MKKIIMTEGNFFKSIIKYTIPIALTNMLQLLYTIADTAVVGQFAGTDSLSAVGGTTPLINLIVNLFIGLSIGSSVSFAKSIGEKNIEKANKVIYVSIILSIIIGAILTIVGVSLARNLLILMDTPSNTIDKSTLYMKIYFSGVIFNILYNFLSSIVRSSGDSTTPLYILLSSGVINILLNLFFVIVLNLDVAGVAIATIISQIYSVIVIIIFMMRQEGALNFKFSNFSFDKDIFKEILQVGVPSGIQTTLFSISNVIIQSTLNSFGSDAVAGNTISQGVEGLVQVTTNAIGLACLNFTGQNLGAKKFDNIKKAVKICLLYGLIITITIPPIIFINAKYILRIFTDSEIVINYAINRMMFHCLPMFTWAVVEVFANGMRGLKHSISPMIILLIGVCFFRVFWIYVIFPLDKTLSMIYISYPISWLMSGIALMISFMIALKKEENKLKLDLNNQVL